jgi:hypothetical protein
MNTLFEMDTLNCPDCGRSLKDGICPWCCDYCDPKAHARKSDPQTSHEAAAKLRPGTHKWLLLDQFSVCDCTDEMLLETMLGPSQ